MSNVSSISGELEKRKADRVVREARLERVEHGGGGGGNMEARVAKLESDVEYIKRDIGEIKADIHGMREDLSQVNVKLATMLERFNHIPSRYEIAAYGIVTLVAIIGGGWALLSRALVVSAAG